MTSAVSEAAVGVGVFQGRDPAACGLDGHGNVAGMSFRKGLPLRKTADTPRRVSAPPATGGKSKEVPMNQWQYSMFQFENGQVAEPANPAQVTLMQALALAGQNSWELVTVLAVRPNRYEFIFKRALQIPAAPSG